MKWMSSRDLLCLTVKLQSSKRIYYSLAWRFNYCCLSKLKREGVKIISQTENAMKEITVHVISLFVVD